MFAANSRYAKMAPYQVIKLNGTIATAMHLPLPVRNPLLGFHRRSQGQRLDLISAHHLADATAFWQLCEANNAMQPDALAVRELIGIPGKGR